MAVAIDEPRFAKRYVPKMNTGAGAWALGIFLLLASCDEALSNAADLAVSSNHDLADASDLALVPTDGAFDGAASDLAFSEGTLLEMVKLTYYWVTSQADYTGANNTILCDASAQTLATVPLAFANALRLEGTGRLVDGRLLNVGSSCQCPSGMTTCYVVLDQAKYPFGLGVQGRALDPYRSVAVDKSIIAIGTPLYVPAFDGLDTPGDYGFVHDGCVIAEDVGGGIDGAHIDFFVAEKKNYQSLNSTIGLSEVDLFVNPTRCQYLE